MADYLRPGTLDEALAALAAGPRLLLAGGTDVYPAHVDRPISHDVLDITGIDALRPIREESDHWRIPALATWTDLIHADLPPMFDGLTAAAREVGGPQIQNMATLAGNICNASPAADGVPPLMTLQAQIELQSTTAQRTLPVESFITGNRRTARGPDEMVTAILVPKPIRPAFAAFAKLGARRYLVISIVMVAGVIEIASDATIAAARLAVGACSEVAVRLPALEAALIGHSIDDPLADLVRPDHLTALAPIDDVRGSAAYRLDAVRTMLRRLVGSLEEACP